MLKNLFLGCSLVLMTSNFNAYAENCSVINAAANQFSDFYLTNISDSLASDESKNKENKQQENSQEDHNNYDSKIETITSKGKGMLSYVFYSRDSSTGLCWINAEAEDVYKMNTVIPSMRLASASFQDEKCVYFNSAKKHLGS